MRADPEAPAVRGVAVPPGVRSRRRPRPSRAVGQVLPGLLLLVFVVFFVLPVAWLLLAATKSDAQLVQNNPLSFGSWHQLRVNWDELTGFQGEEILLWLRNSAVYGFIALVITL